MRLSEIFIALPGKHIYSESELLSLKLKPSFIKKMASLFNLTYMDDSMAESNLCFAESKEMRPEYRTTFSKADLLKNIFSQSSGESVNVEQDEVVFGENFFSS